MPTPQDNRAESTLPGSEEPTSPSFWSPRLTCPPEERRSSAQEHRGADGICEPDLTAEPTQLLQQPTPPTDIESPVEAGAEVAAGLQVTSPTSMDDGEHGTPTTTSRDRAMTATSTLAESREGEAEGESESLSWESNVTLPKAHQSTTVDLSTKNDFSNLRLPPSFSSFLRPGSKFHGTQKSDRQVYDVQVELKHVDISQSFLCGYLRIQGLTEDYPTLTTYFEGEIIGDKYSFQTKRPEWGSNDKVDMQHWARFNAWRPLAKSAKRQDFAYKNFAQKEYMFMRWKEYFLIPDHRVQTISGASFEGFYYICFNQVSGKVSGIYFHAKSEKYQQLELTHVDDRGCFSAMEFR